MPFWRVPAIGGAAALIGVGVAVWPTLTLAASISGAVVVLAFRAPEYAFLVSILLVSFEGSLKAMLGVEGTPFGFSTNALGAALLDACLAVSVLGLLRHDSRSRLQEVWKRVSRAGRVGLVILGCWIFISAVQALTIGSLSEGLHGFRLVQAYVVAGVIGTLLLGRLRRRTRLRLLLGGLLIVSGYAAFRVLVGPSAVEEAYAVSREGVITYGGVVRAAGSFSSAAGLASYLAPAASFAFIVAFAMPRYRLIATLVFALALIGVIASYVRSGIVALALGVIAGGLVLLAQRQWSRRRRLALVTAVSLALATMGVGTVIASRVSAETTTRARGLVNPVADESVQLRIETWESTFQEIRRHPLGTGVGSVGRASAYGGGDIVIADNSYLLILREQGWLGGPMFILGVMCLMVGATLAAVDRNRPFHPIAAAALAGASSFLALGVAGEYIELPGKVLGWLFLGLAVLEIGRASSQEVFTSDP